MDEDKVAQEAADNKKKLIARCIDSVAVFGYFGAIFYAQFSLFLDACDGVLPEEHTLCYTLMAPYNMWLDIEVVSFYLYIVEVFLFVSHYMIRSEIQGKLVSDIRKETTDFIEYSND